MNCTKRSIYLTSFLKKKFCWTLVKKRYDYRQGCPCKIKSLHTLVAHKLCGLILLDMLAKTNNFFKTDAMQSCCLNVNPLLFIALLLWGDICMLESPGHLIWNAETLESFAEDYLIWNFLDFTVCYSIDITVILFLVQLSPCVLIF